jgi:hypothetical protein
MAKIFILELAATLPKYVGDAGLRPGCTRMHEGLLQGKKTIRRRRTSKKTTTMAKITTNPFDPGRLVCLASIVA